MKKPCVNENCGSYDDKKKDNCGHGFKHFDDFECKGYINLDHAEAWDKIVERMEMEVPRNGR